MKRTPLTRRTPLRRAALIRAVTARRTPKRTGFDRATAARIKDRDDWTCVSCGIVRGEVVAHHRRNRGAGGSTDPDTNSARNGLALCWGCNGLMETSPERAREGRERGIKLRHGDPLSTPVRYPDGQWWVLLEGGTRRPATQEEAA